jgi:hypothetical protein
VSDYSSHGSFWAKEKNQHCLPWTQMQHRSPEFLQYRKCKSTVQFQWRGADEDVMRGMTMGAVDF